MSSTSFKHVVSPRNIVEVLNLTPKIVTPGITPKNHIRRSLGENIPSNSPFSCQPLTGTPAASILCTRSPTVYRSPSIHPGTLVPPKAERKSKSARKLPWSDGENLKNTCSPLAQPLSSRYDFSGGECVSKVPSVNTPDRPTLIQKWRKDSCRYSILGRGSFGTVISARYKGKTVAAKVVSTHPKASQQLMNECNALYLKHPNIVSVLKVALPDEEMDGLVIMERVIGRTLQELLDLSIISDNIQQRVKYSLHISEALNYCHNNNVLHLDVKPKNVLVDLCTDTCKLCDFGCSSLIGGNEFSSVQCTVGYAAPEILKGEEATTACDVYSLGVTMWQLASTVNPYNGMGLHSIIYKVVAYGYRPLLPTAKSPADKAFIALIQRCWSQDFQDRPSMMQIISELNSNLYA